MIAYLMQQYYDEGVQLEEEWDGGKQAAEHCPSTWHMLQNDRVRVASFGAGCYWGTEKYFAKDFAKCLRNIWAQGPAGNAQANSSN